MSGDPSSSSGNASENPNTDAAPRAAGPLAARLSGQPASGASPSTPASSKAADQAENDAARASHFGQKPAAPIGSAGSASTMSHEEQIADAQDDGDGAGQGDRGRPRRNKRGKGPRRDDRGNEPVQETRQRVAVPNRRSPLDADLQMDLDAALASADIDQLLTSGPARQGALGEGDRIRASVIKVHDDVVFVALGGPHEGVVPVTQFENPPEAGQTVEVVVRAFSPEDGLYIVVVPGQTIEVQDWSDLQEGAVVEVLVTGVNTGGLTVKLGHADGFMPAGQVAEHRIEDFSDFVGQRLTAVITESSERRRRLVVSRRAVLEREREEKKREQLEKINPGDTLDGTVRSVKDFGAFVDLGGLEGLIHVSKLSWERIKHPSEVIQEGQKVRVKVEKVDKQTGKLSLSYRDLLEHPWDGIEGKYPVGSTVRGTVTRIANYGAFVRIAPGVEGLVHISELAHHKVFKVDNHVKEGQEVEVKVLTIDRDAKRSAYRSKPPFLSRCLPAKNLRRKKKNQKLFYNRLLNVSTQVRFVVVWTDPPAAIPSVCVGSLLGKSIGRQKRWRCRSVSSSF